MSIAAIAIQFTRIPSGAVAIAIYFKQVRQTGKQETTAFRSLLSSKFIELLYLLQHCVLICQPGRDTVTLSPVTSFG